MKQIALAGGGSVESCTSVTSRTACQTATMLHGPLIDGNRKIPETLTGASWIRGALEVNQGHHPHEPD